MKIKTLYIYPIKSLGGISVQNADLLQRGLAFDRRWMLVDSKGVFITQRKLAQLTLMSLELNQSNLIVTSGINGAVLKVPFLPRGQTIEVSIWNDVVRAIEVSPEISAWFSDQLNQSVKLVFMAKDSHRMIDRNYAKNEETVSFADGYPLLLVNIASLQDLNTRLINEVDALRFRPNIVVEGNHPFEEDNWSEIKIGNTKIEVVKPCARCVVVNINPANASKDKEVLEKLATYRKEGNKVLFGVNALVHQVGEISVGDMLEFC